MFPHGRRIGPLFPPGEDDRAFHDAGRARRQAGLAQGRAETIESRMKVRFAAAQVHQATRRCWTRTRANVSGRILRRVRLSLARSCIRSHTSPPAVRARSRSAAMHGCRGAWAPKSSGPADARQTPAAHGSLRRERLQHVRKSLPHRRASASARCAPGQVRKLEVAREIAQAVAEPLAGRRAGQGPGCPGRAPRGGSTPRAWMSGPTKPRRRPRCGQRGFRARERRGSPAARPRRGRPTTMLSVMPFTRGLRGHGNARIHEAGPCVQDLVCRGRARRPARPGDPPRAIRPVVSTSKATKTRLTVHP